MPLHPSVGYIVLATGCLLALIGLVVLIRSFFPLKSTEAAFKRSRRYGGLLFGLGCATSFVSLFALIMPKIGNEQIQLVLSTFQVSSSNAFVNGINKAVTFVLNNAWQVLLVGGIQFVIGLWMLCRFLQEAEMITAYQRPNMRSGKPNPSLWEQPEETPVRQPNPFADLAMWAQERQAKTYTPADHPPAFPTFSEPLLERNRTEETAPTIPQESYAPPASPVASPEPYMPPASPVSTPEPYVPPTPLPVAAPMPNPPAVAEVADGSVPTLPPASGIDINDEAELAKYFTSNEETHEPQMLSSRIRSTMGRHRE